MRSFSLIFSSTLNFLIKSACRLFTKPLDSSPFQQLLAKLGVLSNLHALSGLRMVLGYNNYFYCITENS